MTSPNFHFWVILMLNQKKTHWLSWPKRYRFWPVTYSKSTRSYFRVTRILWLTSGGMWCLPQTAARPLPSVSFQTHYFLIILPFEATKSAILSVSLNDRNTSMRLCCNAWTSMCLSVKKFRSIWCLGRPSPTSASNDMAHPLPSNLESRLQFGNGVTGGCQTVRRL